MKIREKITIFTSVFLITMVVLLTVLSVNSIKSQGEERLDTFKAEEIAAAKSNLKNLVDIAYTTVEENYNHLSDTDYLSKFYTRRLNNIIDTGEAIINRYKQRVSRGEISLSVAKSRAMSEIGKLRFDGGTGYMWINSTAKPYPKMIMHPISPSLNGKLLDNPKYNNALGIRKNLFVSFIDVTSGKEKEGFVDYLWPKPTGSGLTEEVPKLSYVRRYDDWGWILGTGIYLDDARVEIEERIKDTVKTMRYDNGTGYFWINDTSRPYAKMVMHPISPALEGKVLDDPKYNNAQGVGNNLFNAFVDLTAKSGDGFVDYLWPKPTANGLSERKEKVSYVRLHKELGWIIGSGIYIDNIDDAVVVKKKEIDKQIDGLVLNNVIASAIFITLSIIISYLFANTLAKPIKRLTEVSERISKGKDLDKPIMEINRKDEIGELAKSVDRLKQSVKIMMSRLK